MVNNTQGITPLSIVARVVPVYLAVVVATLAALAVLSATDPSEAPSSAWGHAVVVSVLAIVLPMRLRAARTGRRRAIRAVGLIAATLVVVNLVEAVLPGFVPVWMRVQMFVVAALMLVAVLDVIRWAVTHDSR